MTLPDAHADRSPVLLLDALVYIFRAEFSLPDSIRGPDGQPFNAVHGFVTFLAKLLREEQPARMAVAFDASLTTCFRNTLYPDYKANRPPAAPEFKAQIAVCQAVCEALGLLTLADPEFEADDFIATLADVAHQQGAAVTIVSRDKDLAQLLEPDDAFWDGASGERRGPDWVAQHYGVRPDQFADYQGLVGDAVDNIPGVAGIGPKAAAGLMQQFGSLDAALEAAGQDPARIAALPLRGAKRIARLLAEQADSARLSRTLATLRRDVPVDDVWERLRWQPAPKDLKTRLMEAGLSLSLAQKLVLTVGGS